MKRIFIAMAKLRIRMQMRNAASELEAAERRIQQDKQLLNMLWQHKANLHADSLWLEKDNFTVKGLNA